MTPRILPSIQTLNRGWPTKQKTGGDQKKTLGDQKKTLGVTERFTINYNDPAR